MPIESEYAQGDAYDGLEKPVIPAELPDPLQPDDNIFQARKVTEETGIPCFITEEGLKLYLWNGDSLMCHEP